MGTETYGFRGLIDAAQGGDRAAMDQVLEILHPYLQHLARGYADPLRPAESTSDLLQESCLRAWKGLGSFEGGENDEQTFHMFRSWVGQIVRRIGINSLRNRRRQRRSPTKTILPLDAQGTVTSTMSDHIVHPPLDDLTPASSAGKAERMRRIEKALVNLPDETSAAIIRLHLFQGFTMVKVAEKLGLHYEKVRRRYRAAIRQLKGELEGLF